MRDLDGKRLGVHLRVVEGGFDIQVSEIAGGSGVGKLIRCARAEGIDERSAKRIVDRIDRR